MKTPSAILCSDFHLREDSPVCRTDDFWETQWKKVNFIGELQKKYNCPVFHAGDLFHHWKPSPYLLSETIKHIPDRFYTIYGQHDLPQHSLELKQKSGIYTLEKAGKLKVLSEASWGQKPGNGSMFCELEEPKKGEEIWISNKHRKVLVWHNFTYIGKEPFPGAKGKAHALLEKYKQFDLIVTGDNHQSFTSRGLHGNLLVNPGSLMRQEAGQIDFQPKVYLWHAESNTVKAVRIPIVWEAVTREHIESVEERDERIDAYISRFDKDWESYLHTNGMLNFKENINMFFQTNRVRKEVKQIIYNVL